MTKLEQTSLSLANEVNDLIDHGIKDIPFFPTTNRNNAITALVRDANHKVTSQTSALRGTRPDEVKDAIISRADAEIARLDPSATVPTTTDLSDHLRLWIELAVLHAEIATQKGLKKALEESWKRLNGIRGTSLPDRATELATYIHSQMAEWLALIPGKDDMEKLRTMGHLISSHVYRGTIHGVFQYADQPTGSQEQAPDSTATAPTNAYHARLATADKTRLITDITERLLAIYYYPNAAGTGREIWQQIEELTDSKTKKKSLGDTLTYWAGRIVNEPERWNENNAALELRRDIVTGAGLLTSMGTAVRLTDDELRDLLGIKDEPYNTVRWPDLIVKELEVRLRKAVEEHKERERLSVYIRDVRDIGNFQSNNRPNQSKLGEKRNQALNVNKEALKKRIAKRFPGGITSSVDREKIAVGIIDEFLNLQHEAIIQGILAPRTHTHAHGIMDKARQWRRRKYINFRDRFWRNPRSRLWIGGATALLGLRHAGRSISTLWQRGRMRDASNHGMPLEALIDEIGYETALAVSSTGLLGAKENIDAILTTATRGYPAPITNYAGQQNKEDSAASVLFDRVGQERERIPGSRQWRGRTRWNAYVKRLQHDIRSDLDSGASSVDTIISKLIGQQETFFKAWEKHENDLRKWRTLWTSEIPVAAFLGAKMNQATGGWWGRIGGWFTRREKDLHH